MKNRYCVTGGLGFIGSHFVDLLLKNGHEVTVIDDMSSNVIQPLTKCKRTFTEPIVVLDFRRLSEFDVLVHLASVVGPVGVLSVAGDIVPSIIRDTKKLVDYCVKNEILFVDVSTSEVYGHGGTLSEDSRKECTGRYSPRSEYGVGKLAAEIMVCNTARVKRLNYRIIRPFNVSGPRQDPQGGFVLPRFVIAALTGQVITVYGDGSQVRSIAHINDVCDSTYCVLETENTSGIWNVGNPDNTTSILELARLVIEQVGQGTIKFVDPKSIHGDLFEEVGDKIACIDKIKGLGWRPKYSLERVVVDVISYYRSKIKTGYEFDVE